VALSAEVDRICRIARVACAHAYALIRMFTRNFWEQPGSRDERQLSIVIRIQDTPIADSGAG
jgi:hypothetical protein